ncbi:MAG: CRISPR-associated endonuclease Cas2 [Clostridia bacterium]|nr:CRISPR-associated endonuclease Cas2 [Clostridia bacterium]
MRVLVFFDLPVETSEQRRKYRYFHKFLIRSGFVMMQKSVYSKIVLNATAASSVMENVRRNRVTNGLIQMMVITERQYEKIEFVSGEGQKVIIDSDDKLVIL